MSDPSDLSEPSDMSGYYKDSTHLRRIVSISFIAGETIMPWEKVPPENEAWLARMVADYPDAEKRKMFGCPVYFIGGNMWVGAHETNFILRLPPADQEEILRHPAITHFTPMGRPMREYVLITPEANRDEDWFRGWLQRSAAYVRTLPPPVKKDTRKRTTRKAV